METPKQLKIMFYYYLTQVFFGITLLTFATGLPLGIDWILGLTGSVFSAVALVRIHLLAEKICKEVKKNGENTKRRND